MGEGDTQATAAALGTLVVQAGLIALAQLAGNIKAQAGAFVVGGIERLKYILQLFVRYARAIIQHFEHRKVANGVTKQVEPHLALWVALAAVAQAVPQGQVW